METSALNYAEFNDFLLTHLWRQGDSVVAANLPQIIKTAEAELDTRFKVEERNAVSAAQAIGRQVSLPSDYRSMIALSNPRLGGMKYVTQQDYASKVVRYSSGSPSKYYTVSNSAIWLTGAATPTSPFDMTMVYYRRVPDFQATDESWLADKFFNVYLYCVLKHTAPFLREDERVGTWVNFFNEAFDTAMEENAHDVKYAGSPITMKFGGIK